MTPPQAQLSYVRLLRAPDAAGTFGAALVGRLSYGVVFLSLVLSIAESTGSYAVAGGFMALFGATSALLSPVRAGLIDRHGPRRALPAMAGTYALLLLVLAVMTWRSNSPGWPLLALGAAAGAFTPPLGPIMRTLWRDLVAEESLQRAYSLDSVAEELIYVTGPLLVGVIIVFAHPALGVVLSAALVVLGTLLLLASPAALRAQQQTDVRRRHERATGPRARRSRGAVRRQQGVVRAVVVTLGVGGCLGAVNLLVVAFATEHHHVAGVAWVEAALSLGSVLGGLAYGASTWETAPATRLCLLAVALGLAVGAAGFAPNVAVLTGLVGVAGLFVSPALTTAYLVADEAATADAPTQAGTWVNTGFNVGDSFGAAGIGMLVSRVPLLLCFVVAGTAAAGIATFARLGDEAAKPTTRPVRRC